MHWGAVAVQDGSAHIMHGHTERGTESPIRNSAVQYIAETLLQCLRAKLRNVVSEDLPRVAHLQPMNADCEALAAQEAVDIELVLDEPRGERAGSTMDVRRSPEFVLEHALR